MKITWVTGALLSALMCHFVPGFVSDGWRWAREAPPGYFASVEVVATFEENEAVVAVLASNQAVYAHAATVINLESPIHCDDASCMRKIHLVSGERHAMCGDADFAAGLCSNEMSAISEDDLLTGTIRIVDGHLFFQPENWKKAGAISPKTEFTMVPNKV